MTKLQFFLTDINYKLIDDKPVIYLFGRTDTGKQIIAIDREFKPYFYIIPKANETKKLIEELTDLKLEKDENITIHKIKEDIRNLYGKETTVLRIEVQSPKHVPIIREEIKTHPLIEGIFEADIHYVRRYLVDKEITPLKLITIEGEFISLRARVPVLEIQEIFQSEEQRDFDPTILAVDIETYNPLGKMIDYQKFPILMIAIAGKDYKKVLCWKNFPTKESTIEFVSDEKTMLRRFFEIIVKEKPDILCGYYSDGFDLPYIEERAKIHKLNLDLGLDHSQIQIKGQEQKTAMINGIVHVDVFKFVRKIVSSTLQTASYSLDAVSEQLLGEKKDSIDVSGLAQAWDTGERLEEYCCYNLKDAELTYKLCDKMFPNMKELSSITGLPFYDIIRMAFSQLVEGFLIKQAFQYKEIVPNKPGYHDIKTRRSHSYEGAFVYEPTPGIYDQIAVFDFRSLYPTIISSHNIGIASLNCNCCRNEAARTPLKNHDYYYCTKKKGFIPLVIEDLVTRRMRIKEIINKKGLTPILNARQDGLKLLANSFYGYLAFFGARWYSLEAAESTTAWGRFYITEVIDKAKNKGFKILYSDTDSVLFCLGKHSKEEALQFADAINRELPGLMELEFEGLYPRGIFVSLKQSGEGAKKKYALLSEDNTIIIKGFETVRRNWSIIGKVLQEKVISIILRENNPEKAVSYIQEVIDDLRNNRISVEDVTIVTQLSKDIEEYDAIGPHVAVAKQMVINGKEVGPGTMIKYIIGKGKGKIAERAIDASLAKQNDYDPDYYIDHQIIPAIDRILSLLGYDSKKLITDQDQSNLDKFF